MITVYFAPWCDYCTRLIVGLDEIGIAHTDIDVEQDEAAADFVKSVNDGNRITPTVLFADASTLTNPSVSQVRTRMLAARR